MDYAGAEIRLGLGARSSHSVMIVYRRAVLHNYRRHGKAKLDGKWW